MPLLLPRHLALLATGWAYLALVPGAASQEIILPRPPDLSTVAFEDSVWWDPHETDRKWVYRIGTVEGESFGWIEIRDPYGGRIIMPRVFFHQASDRSVALSENTDFRIIAAPTRTQFRVILGMLAFALLSAAGIPILLFRRRLVREKETRRQLQETARQLAESREDERLRIARDLHDGPLQDLHALHMQLGVAADALAQAYGGPAPEAGRIRGAQDEAHSVIGELRGIAESLRPPALGPFGLAAALRAHAERFRRSRPDITLDLDLDDDGQALPEPVRLALFRIAQEALSNAAKHGDPGRVAVTLRVNDRDTSLDICDDGSGLARDPDEDTLTLEGHFGVLGMRERAGAVDGQLTIEEPEEGGVRVLVRVPWGRQTI